MFEKEEKGEGIYRMKEEWSKEKESLFEFAGYPPSLIKSFWDEFQYAMKLKNNDQVINFTKSCPVNREWVRVYPESMYNDDWRHDPPCPRGIDIHMNSIEWVADAPYGS